MKILTKFICKIPFLRRKYGFMAEEEIVEVILKFENIEELGRMDKGELISLHFGFGMAIRNRFKLWHKDNPLTFKDHPDEVSMRIINTVWERLNYIGSINISKQEI